jgi:hypothetical protein
MTGYEFLKPAITRHAVFILLTIGLWRIFTSHKARIRFFPSKTRAVVSGPQEFSRGLCGLWQCTVIRIQLTPAGFTVLGLALVVLPYLASCMISTSIAGNLIDTDHERRTIMGKDSIGSARMEMDGTIILQLRAESPGGLKGDALFQYPPGHPEYKNVLQHLGGLEKGQEKPVPPWKDQK